MVKYAYDIMDRVTNISWRTSNGATLGGFAYEYDAVGRITSRSHVLGTNAFDRVYSYDDLDRLASDGDVAYTYDAAGNRMTRTDDGETITYTLDLTWNSQYQLVSVSTNGVFAEGYAYDALSRRVSTTTLEGTTRHVYDDNWQVIADINEDGSVVASYVWGEGIDNLLAVTIGGVTFYPLIDVQGTVWGYVDSQDNIVARWTYDAWGNVIDETVSVPALATLRYRFQGREWAAATGLINFRMRWYDAETGRWLSKDPIGLSGGLNLYVFCGDAPILFRDPNGELLPQIAAAVGVAAIFYIIYRHAVNMKRKMENADINDLRDVTSSAIDCAEDTMTSITPVFGPPLPDATLPLTDKASETLARPIWHNIFNGIRPLK